MEGSLAPPQISDLHGLDLLGDEHFPLAPEQDDPDTGAATNGTGPYSLTPPIGQVDRAPAHARHAPRERARADGRGLLGCVKTPRTAVDADAVVVVVVSFVVVVAAMDRHVFTSRTATK
jgi:hypothetical protein